MITALAITGPTASGKTALSLGLCEHIGGEIISADSMQIYRGMNIGTAKATPEEQSRVPHHMIDVVSPTESYSVEEYRKGALAAAGDIAARGKIPVFVGGTGLYVDSLVRASQTDAPESNPAYRAALFAEAERDGGADRLWERLREVDPESAEAIHKNNVKRVIRALEIYDATGITKTELDRRSKEKSPEISVGMITLDFSDRELLYRRIDERVGTMLSEGLLDEVRTLYGRGELSEEHTASAAIGYKEMTAYLRGECSIDEAADAIRLASRRYAKRQLTWFRHNTGAYRLTVDRDGRMRPYSELVAEAIEAAERFLNKI